MDNKINVITYNNNESKGLFDSSISFVERQIDSQIIIQNINNLIETLCDGLKEIKQFNIWMIDEITIQVGISATGEVKLVGALGAGVSGGVEIKLKRNDI